MRKRSELAKSGRTRFWLNFSKSVNFSCRSKSGPKRMTKGEFLAVKKPFKRLAQRLRHLRSVLRESHARPGRDRRARSYIYILRACLCLSLRGRLRQLETLAT